MGRTQEEGPVQVPIKVERVAEMDSLHCSVRDVLVDVEVDGRARVERRVVEGDRALEGDVAGKGPKCDVS